MHLQSSDAGLRDLRHEAEMLARLSHPRIVNFCGACLRFPNVCVVQELAVGGSLHAYLHGPERRPLEYGQVLQVSRFIDCGLALPCLVVLFRTLNALLNA